MSTLKVNSIEPANAGSEDYFLARAWVNFNGTGTVAVRASGNVSSITDVGVGIYGINMSSAMVDASYNYALSGKYYTSVIIPTCVGHNTVDPTASTLTMQTWNGVSALNDSTTVCAAITR